VLNFASLSSVLLFLPSQGLPQEYIILFRRPNHPVHGTAFSSLTGIAGGFIKYNNRKKTFDLIQALEPDIVIVTSEGISLIEQLFGKKFENHLFVYNKILFVALGHPSICFTDDYIINSVAMIKNNIVEK
jgi:hypothetical protein